MPLPPLLLLLLQVTQAAAGRTDTGAVCACGGTLGRPDMV